MCISDVHAVHHVLPECTWCTAGCLISPGKRHSSSCTVTGLGVASCHCNEDTVVYLLFFLFICLFVCLPFQLFVPRWPQLQSRPHWFVSADAPRSHQSDASEWAFARVKRSPRRRRFLSSVRGDASPHQPQIHPIMLALSENPKACDWLTSSGFVLRMLLGQSSSAALLCWRSRVRCHGDIKSQLSVRICVANDCQRRSLACTIVLLII